MRFSEESVQAIEDEHEGNQKIGSKGSTSLLACLNQFVSAWRSELARRAKNSVHVNYPVIFIHLRYLHFDLPIRTMRTMLQLMLITWGRGVTQGSVTNKSLEQLLKQASEGGFNIYNIAFFVSLFIIEKNDEIPKIQVSLNEPILGLLFWEFIRMVQRIDKFKDIKKLSEASKHMDNMCGKLKNDIHNQSLRDHVSNWYATPSQQKTRADEDIEPIEEQEEEEEEEEEEDVSVSGSSVSLFTETSFISASISHRFTPR
mmetsp:Transcript_17880/g.21059  ORF Transcript_17880/g.21059 Transcript_17880/m.21059 type:complete len:258 (-) Transcript_17880:463-1236(-)